MKTDKKTVLLVDDEKNMLICLGDLLKAEFNEIEVLTAQNGLEALETVRRHPVDLVLTDLNLPGLDGYQLLAALGARFPTIPVFVTSAYAAAGVREKVLGLGALDLLTKPFNLEELCHGIDRTLAGGYRQGKTKLEGVDLSSFLQRLNREGETCKLTVYQEDFAGALYLEEGSIVHAERDQYSGPGAAAWIISDHFAKGGEILHECGSGTLPGKRTVETDLYHILLKAAENVRDLAAWA